jgi:hypothetical protein
MLSATWSFIWTPDFAGLVFGVAGTLLLATRGRWAGWGFVAFLASNVGWLAYAWQSEALNLLIQQAVFAVSSLVGIWTWLLRDRVRRPVFQDTQRLEEDIWRRFDGANGAQLARRHGITVAEVYEILVQRGRR